MQLPEKVCPECARRYEAGATFCQRDGARLIPADGGDPYVGTKLLGQFEILERVGAGGMGAVYRARQTTLDRDVAIKILHRELAGNPDAVRRFKREAKVSTALDHPNVVRVFLFGQLPDGSLYIVMEYLRGKPLLQLLQDQGALPVHRALHIATQVCDGVGEAHAHGVVHRDIKPENIVLVKRTRDPDHVKVLDFGIARVLWGDDTTMATQSGLVFGTARYISPEGAAGEPTDARSDVYSLGILTYQLLAGETPFDAPSPVAMLMKHLHRTPPHLLSTERGAHVPEPVADVVMRALTKNPEGRYPDGYAFGQALRAAAERAGFGVHGSVRGPSITPPETFVPGVSRKARRRDPSTGTVIRDQAKASEGVAPPPAVAEPTPPLRAAAPTPIARPATKAAEQSPTLANAPSPFAEPTGPLSIPGLGLGGDRRPWSPTAKWAAVAFAVGALAVLGAFGISRLDLGAPVDAAAHPELDGWIDGARHALGTGRLDGEGDDTVLALTARVLEVEPAQAEALELRRRAASELLGRAEAATDRDTRRVLLERARVLDAEVDGLEEALAALDAPARGPRPGVFVEGVAMTGQRVTLRAVLAPGLPVGARPRFQLRRGGRNAGAAIPARSVGERTYEAPATFRRAGTHEVLFRAGRGRDQLERRTTVDVEADPDRPRRPTYDDDPPVTTLGSQAPAPPSTPSSTPSPAGGPTPTTVSIRDAPPATSPPADPPPSSLPPPEPVRPTRPPDEPPPAPRLPTITVPSLPTTPWVGGG
jgi:serine/threonine protein kinase